MATNCKPENKYYFLIMTLYKLSHSTLSINETIDKIWLVAESLGIQ